MEFNAFPRLLAVQHQPALLSAFSQVIQSGVFLNGHFLQTFEAQLGNYFQVKHVLGVSSGHDALQLAILSLQLQPTDEVLFPVNAYPTAFAVCMAGVTPVAVDVDDNGQLDLDDLERKITPQSKAIILVHLYGFVGEMEKILTISKKNKLEMIEDCAQSFGSTYQGKLTGTFGKIGCFSFYPTKNLGTIGDGGAIITNHHKYHQQISMARSYGEKKKYQSQFISNHSRLAEIQAAALTIYFDHFSELAIKKQRVFQWYQEAFAAAQLASRVRLCESHPNSQPVPHLVVITATRRNQLQAYLQKQGIETMIHYPKAVHQLPAFKDFSFTKRTYPGAERLQKKILSLPFHQDMTKKDVLFVVTHIREFYET